MSELNNIAQAIRKSPRWTKEQQLLVANLVKESFASAKGATEDQIAIAFFKLQHKVIKDPALIRGPRIWGSVRGWLLPYIKEDKMFGKQKPLVAVQVDVYAAEIDTLKKEISELNAIVSEMKITMAFLQQDLKSLKATREAGISSPTTATVKTDTGIATKRTFIKPTVNPRLVIEQLPPQVTQPPKEKVDLTIVGVIDKYKHELLLKYEDVVNFTILGENHDQGRIKDICKDRSVIVMMPFINKSVVTALKQANAKMYKINTTGISSLTRKIDEILAL